MKPSLLLVVLLAISLSFSFSACNSNDQTTDTSTTDSDTTVTTSTTTTTAPPNTTITTPQSIMIARHRVKDFTNWKASYDAHDSLRQVNGLRNYVIGRSMTDSNMVLVAVRTDDINKAKAFSKDASLRQAMQRGGVAGTPTFNFINWTWQDTGTVNSDIRSMVMLNIKAWTPWKASFESGRQERQQNGLADRAYGHQADDTTKAVVVVAVLDTAKARAYWESDQLKQRRTQGGVTGTPQRFVFRVVQRY